MSVVQFLKQSVTFIHQGFTGAGAGLSVEQLHFSPTGDSHPIAWIVWHGARIEDFFVQQVFQGKPQLWDEGGWAAKTGLPEKGIGTGQATDDAKAVRIKDLDAFREYAGAVAARTDAFLDGLSDDDLAREVALGQRVERLGEAISLHFVTHLNGHRGEVNTLRGIMGFPPVMLNRGG